MLLSGFLFKGYSSSKRINHNFHVHNIIAYITKEVLVMKNKRAKEIADSPDMIKVTYNGIPVYIEDINEDNNIAKIRFLDQSNKIDEVSITNLEEH